jgi:hypothetical protein
MQGRRVYNDLFQPGDYGKVGFIWHARPPKGGLGNLGNHEVTEHEDGTITVSPSILVTSHNDNGEKVVWHGYLEKGVWREC